VIKMITTDDIQGLTDVFSFGKVSEARAVKAPPSSGKQDGQPQLICI